MIKEKSLFKLCITALLCVLAVVANRFLGINTQFLSISVSFVPVMVCSMLLGPLYGGVCGGLADLIGALLFPFGPFFPGFTLTAFFSGALFGFIPTKSSGKRFFSVTFLIFLLEEVFCTVLLNSLWISLLYGSPFFPLVLTRLPKATVLVVLGPFVAFLIKKHLLPPINKIL